jgi:hypothetical protein
MRIAAKPRSWFAASVVLAVSSLGAACVVRGGEYSMVRYSGMTLLADAYGSAMGTCKSYTHACMASAGEPPQLRAEPQQRSVACVLGSTVGLLHMLCQRLAQLLCVHEPQLRQLQHPGSQASACLSKSGESRSCSATPRASRPLHALAHKLRAEPSLRSAGARSSTTTGTPNCGMCETKDRIGI